MHGFAIILFGICIVSEVLAEDEVKCSAYQWQENLLTEMITIKSQLKEMENKLAAQQKDHGAVYTRWGRSTCPIDAELVYHGYIAGKKWNDPGSGSNNLCLHHSPTWGHYQDGFDGWKGSMYGTELDMVEPSNVFPYSVNENDLPCAVCKSSRKTSMMIPARTNCNTGWTLEYTGYLMSGRGASGHGSYDTVCVDALPEFIPHGGDNDNGHVLYLVEAHCGSLPCPPYEDGRELACAVCTI